MVINVLVEEQSTGEFSVMGGFSTANGWMAQASVAEHNLFGTGRYAKTSVTYGQFIRAAELSFVEPYLLDQRMSGGIDLFARQTLANTFLSYGTETYGGSLKLGVPLREDLSLQLRYSLFTQKVTLPSSLDDCQNINPDFVNTFPTPNAISGATAQDKLWPGYNGNPVGCFASSQASLPIRLELANGAFLTSLAGYGLTYNTLDNNKHPTGGMLLSFGQDFAGLGGDVAYMRTVADFRTYYEVVSDLVGVLHLQGGNMIGLNGLNRADARRLQDGAESGARIPARGHRSARLDTGYDGRRARRYAVLGRQRRIPIPVLLLAEGFRPARRGVLRFRFGLGLQGRNIESGDGRNQRRHQRHGRSFCVRR